MLRNPRAHRRAEDRDCSLRHGGPNLTQGLYFCGASGAYDRLLKSKWELEISLDASRTLSASGKRRPPYRRNVTLYSSDAASLQLPHILDVLARIELL
jgi:hypothetical protein